MLPVGFAHQLRVSQRNWRATVAKEGVMKLTPRGSAAKGGSPALGKIERIIKLFIERNNYRFPKRGCDSSLYLTSYSVCLNAVRSKIQGSIKAILPEICIY